MLQLMCNTTLPTSGRTIQQINTVDLVLEWSGCYSGQMTIPALTFVWIALMLYFWHGGQDAIDKVTSALFIFVMGGNAILFFTWRG